MPWNDNEDGPWGGPKGNNGGSNPNNGRNQWNNPSGGNIDAVSYTHLTLPTNREV